MGQHRVSTLRVLVRLMRDIHSDVFDVTTGLGEENDSWTHVWFRLDATWGMQSEKKIEDKIWLSAGLYRIGALSNEVHV